METYYVIIKNKLNGSKQYFAISDFGAMYWTNDSEDAMWFATYDDAENFAKYTAFIIKDYVIEEIECEFKNTLI